MTPGSDDPRDSGHELDEPLAVLREQERETSQDFVAKVRGKIHRRTTASQVASFSWVLPKVILIELAGILKHLFTATAQNKDS